jgi:hypothetical protein
LGLGIILLLINWLFSSNLLSRSSLWWNCF